MFSKSIVSSVSLFLVAALFSSLKCPFKLRAEFWIPLLIKIVDWLPSVFFYSEHIGTFGLRESQNSAVRKNRLVQFGNRHGNLYGGFSYHRYRCVPVTSRNFNNARIVKNNDLLFGAWATQGVKATADAENMAGEEGRLCTWSEVKSYLLEVTTVKFIRMFFNGKYKFV